MLLGCAALSKNEGYVIIVVTIVAVALTHGVRAATRLWPAIAVGTPWLILRATHHLATQLASGPVAERFVANTQQWHEIVQLIAQHAAGKPILWLGVILSLACAARRWIARERLLLIVAALQMLSYIAAYLITPFGLVWHIRWSWDRIADRHFFSYGTGFDLRTPDNVWTLTAEVFGQAGSAEINSVVQPRFQAGLRFRPVDRFNIDLIYGRNIAGENANWVTVATVIRFPPPEK